MKIHYFYGGTAGEGFTSKTLCHCYYVSDIYHTERKKEVTCKKCLKSLNITQQHISANKN